MFATVFSFIQPAATSPYLILFKIFVAFVVIVLVVNVIMALLGQIYRFRSSLVVRRYRGTEAQ